MQRCWNIKLSALFVILTNFYLVSPYLQMEFVLYLYFFMDIDAYWIEHHCWIHKVYLEFWIVVWNRKTEILIAITGNLFLGRKERKRELRPRAGGGGGGAAVLYY